MTTVQQHEYIYNTPTTIGEVWELNHSHVLKNNRCVTMVVSIDRECIFKLLILDGSYAEFTQSQVFTIYKWSGIWFFSRQI